MNTCTTITDVNDYADHNYSWLFSRNDGVYANAKVFKI